MKISYASEKISRTISKKDDLDALNIPFSTSKQKTDFPLPLYASQEASENFHQAEGFDYNSEICADGESISSCLSLFLFL